MSSSQDGKWVMRWNSTERLTLKNKKMNSKHRLQCILSQLHKYVRQTYMQIFSLLYLEVVSFPQRVAG